MALAAVLPPLFQSKQSHHRATATPPNKSANGGTSYRKPAPARLDYFWKMGHQFSLHQFFLQISIMENKWALIHPGDLFNPGKTSIAKVISVGRLRCFMIWIMIGHRT
jgi:hypothetical protein